MIVGRPAPHFAALTEAGDRAIDQLRIDPAEIRPADLQLIDGAGTLVLHHDVGDLRQPVDDLPAFGRFQVHGDGAFAAIHRDERRTDEPIGLARKIAKIIAAIGLFDLDDVRADEAEMIRAEWAGQGMSKVKDSNSLQGLHLIIS